MATLVQEKPAASVTYTQNVKPSVLPTRLPLTRSSDGRNQSALRDATLRMGRSIKGVPDAVANIWYGFTRSEPRNARGHLCGAWPDVARAFARKGAPLQDVMAPADQVRLELKRDVYALTLPSLQEVEQREAEVVCQIQKAEIVHDALALREAAREEVIVAELLEEVADRETTR